MLKNIRDNIQGTAAKVIIGIITIPFIFFGVDSLFTGGGPAAAAVVNGQEIEEYELAQAIALQKRRLISMMGQSVDASMLEDSVLRQPALQGLVDQKLLLIDAEEKGLAVAPKVLNDTIVSMEQFHVDGKFSQERYLQVLRNMGFGNAMFKNLLGTDLLLSQVRSGISGTAFLTPAQLNLAVALAEQKRSYNYLMITPEDLIDQVELSDTEIEAWYAENSEEFRSAEAVKLSYIELKLEDFTSAVSEEDLRAEYEQELKSLDALEERHAAHILISTEDRSAKAAKAIVTEIQKALAAGESFETLAKQKSDDPGSASDGGDLGFTAGDAFPEDFEAALAMLEPGEVSDIVETEDGLHLIKLLEVKTRKPASFEQRRAEIEARIQRLRAEPKLLAAVEQLRDLVFNADGLNAPAQALKLSVQNTEWLERDSDSALLQNPAVAAAAFDKQLRSESLNSDVFELRSDYYLVLHINEYREPAVQPLAAVRAQVVQRLKRERAVELVATKSAELEQQIAAGESVESVAVAGGFEWQAVIDGLRTTSDVPRPVLEKAFSMAPDGGRKVAVVDGSGGSRWLVNLYRVDSVAPESVTDAQRQKLGRTFTGGRASQEFAAYFGSLKQSADIRIPQSAATP